MGEQGARFSEGTLTEMYQYVQSMLDDGRIIAIDDDQGIFAVIFFSICDDAEPFLKKGTWEFKPHIPHGRIAYIEKAVAKGWNKKVRKQLADLIYGKFPTVDSGKWHRWGKIGDREVNTRRNRYVTV